MWTFPSPVSWLSGLFTWLAALVVFFGGLLGSSGCTATAPQGFPGEFSQAASQITTSVADQAVWEKISASLDGSVIEPGYEGYAGMLYVAGGKIRGFSGHVGASAIGDGSGALTPEAREAILGYLAGDERYRDFLLRLIGVVKAPAESAESPAAQAPEPDADEVVGPPAEVADPPAATEPAVPEANVPEADAP